MLATVHLVHYTVQILTLIFFLKQRKFLGGIETDRFQSVMSILCIIIKQKESLLLLYLLRATTFRMLANPPFKKLQKAGDKKVDEKGKGSPTEFNEIT